MSDTLIDDDEMLLKRFACDCGVIEDAMDVLLEKDTNEVIFDWYITPIGLWDKLKRIGGILIGRNVCYHEFILRKEDIGELIELLEKAKEGK
jgi:hypothetical protein